MTHGTTEGPRGPEEYGTGWYLRVASMGPAEHGPWSVRAYLTDDHPDGTTIGPGVDDSAYPEGRVLWRVAVDAQLRRRVSVARWAVEGVPPLWAVEIPDEGGARPGCSLVAFDTDDLPPGTVLTNAEFAAMPVDSAQQVAAVHWSTDTVTIDQIFVTPELRRRHVGTWLVYVADALHHHHGWPGLMNVSGRRTDVAEEAQGRHLHRVAPRTERVVVIDPDTGIPAP